MSNAIVARRYIQATLFDLTGKSEICSTKTRFRSNEALAAIIREYETGVSIRRLSLKHSIGEQTLTARLKEAGIHVRNLSEARRANHPVREDAFDVVTEESAYWIGFLMADGSVSDRGEVRLCLKSDDAHHVSRFSAFMGSGKTASVGTYMTTKGMRSIAYIAFESPRLKESLSRYGVVPRKSMSEKVALLEGNRHFWRGVIDGDGSVILCPRRGAHIRLVGSETLVSQFKAYLGQIGISSGVAVSPMRSIYQFSLTGPKGYAAISAIYGSCNVALDRKLRTAKAILATESLAGDRRFSLNEEAVVDIWTRIIAGEPHGPIAKDHGVSKGTISDIKRGSWSHLTGTLPGRPKFRKCGLQNAGTC